MPTDPLKPGDVIGDHYLVTRQLGSGGFGQVVLAEDKVVSGRLVAVKILHVTDFLRQDDLIREMELLSRLAHPNIVTFHHHFHRGEQLCLVMEYCGRGSLARYADAGPLPEAKVFDWARTLASTMGFVHARGIVHHNIKPQNVLLTGEGTIKIGDFGIANRQGGTPLYLPPESLLGEDVAATDTRIDVYGLGITLLELLLGRHPLEELPRPEAIHAKIDHNFIPPSLPKWVQEVLLKATHPTPELRFQTMEEFCESIESRHVPYVLDGNRVKAHRLADKAEHLIKKKKWKAAKRNVNLALHTSADCVAALVAAGRLALLMKRLQEAQEYFAKAIQINPRVSVQKELGWLNLEAGEFPRAISMLNDYLQRNAADFEACNLLLQCFYLTERYEQGEDLAALMMKQKDYNDCFRNNRFICRLLRGGYTADELAKIDLDEIVNPFIHYNFIVATEQPSSWETRGVVPLKSKVLFEDFRSGVFNPKRKLNTLTVTWATEREVEFDHPIVTIGRLEANDICLLGSGHSRRHAVIVNYVDDVWVYDLGSAAGVMIDDQSVSGKAYLDGVRQVSFGPTVVSIAAKTGLLL